MRMTSRIVLVLLAVLIERGSTFAQSAMIAPIVSTPHGDDRTPGSVDVVPNAIAAERVVESDLNAQDVGDWSAYLGLRTRNTAAPENAYSYEALWAQGGSGIRGNVTSAALDTIRPIPFSVARRAIDTSGYVETLEAPICFYVVVQYGVLREDKFLTAGPNARIYVLERAGDEWKIVQVSEPVLETLIGGGFGTGSAAELEILERQRIRFRSGQFLDSHGRSIASGRRFVIAPQAHVFPSNIIVGHYPNYPNCQFQYLIGTVDFIPYVKNVLPNEWGPPSSFPMESLKAGAITAKMVGWWRKYNAKYPNLGIDVSDSTCDQVYRANSAVARTDDAVCQVAGVGFDRADGVLFYPSYVAGSYNNTGFHGGTMYQNGTWYLADHGYLYQDMVHYYYDSSSSSSFQLAHIYTYNDTDTSCGVAAATVTVNSASATPQSTGTTSTFTINYNVTSSAATTVLLGASLRLHGGSTLISDSAHDSLVSLPAGTSNVSRQFSVSAAAGVYDLLVAVWRDQNNSGTIDGADQQLSAMTLMSYETLTATQSCNSLTLTRNPSNGGTINATPSGSIPCNVGLYLTSTPITFTATAATGFQFVGWSGSGGAFSTTSQATTIFTITGNAQVTAAFAVVDLACSYSISPTTGAGVGPGGNGNVQVTGSPSGCTGSWSASASSTGGWLTLTGTTNSSGSGTWLVPYSYPLNPSTTSSRAGTVSFSGSFPSGGTFTLTQSPSTPGACGYSISPQSATGPASGSSGNVQVTGSPNGCAGSWSAGASSTGNWLALTGTTTGSGAGTTVVPYSFSANPNAVQRVGSISFSGSFSSTFTLTQDAAIAGSGGSDFCSSAVVVSGSSFANSQTTSGATKDVSDPTACFGSGDASVWYRYTAPASGTVTVDTIGSGYDTVLSTFTGSCGSLTSVPSGCDDDGGGNLTSSATFSVSSGVTYFFMVTAYSGSGGSLSFHLNAVLNDPTGTASSFYVITPCRIIDTRNSTPLGNLATLDVTVAGVCGIPPTAVAVVANITAVAPASDGFLALYPTGSTWPGNSTLNYRIGKTRANNAILRLSAGKTTVLNNGSVQNFIIDVTGYFQ